MGSTCRMTFKVLESPLGKIEISGCEAGVHRVKLLGKMSPRPESHEVASSGNGRESPAETAALAQCAAWLEAYFCAPEMVKDLPLPPLHHPLFQQGRRCSRHLGQLICGHVDSPVWVEFEAVSTRRPLCQKRHQHPGFLLPRSCVNPSGLVSSPASIPFNCFPTALNRRCSEVAGACSHQSLSPA
ncbi:methylated-DNA--protein-cysteine methyltransferase isoform X3 [Sminthopsis crassicaudata]|uniref:methylated-DNA--protein-cysteine methyltransferase isoform X3 n=1 Tax=Sminthopsis crassicaudata TaxID=9301 RepID=UPI003D6863FD